MKLSEIKSGTKLELEIFDEEGQKINPTFKSEFEWALDDENGVIAAPISESIIFPVRIGAPVNLYFKLKDDMYFFDAVVTQRNIVDNIAMLSIKMKSEIHKIQRREFYRFECCQPLKYRVVEFLNPEYNKEVPFKKTITRDLSGGGMAILVNERVGFNKLMEFELTLEEDRIVKAFGRVVRVSEFYGNPTYKYELGISFKKIENRDKEAIIRFIFNELRKLRQKGLM